MEKTRYIEFVGVAGSGKTRATELLCRVASQAQIPLVRRVPIGFQLGFRVRVLLEVLRSIYQVPELLKLYSVRPRAYYAQTPYIVETLRNLVRRLVIDTAVICVTLRTTEMPFVNDEGIVGKLVSCAVLGEVAQDTVVTLMQQLLPAGTVMLFIDTSPSVAEAREVARTTVLPFFDAMEKELKTTFFTEATALYRTLLATNAVRHMTLNNEGDIAVLEQQINGVVSMVFSSV